MPIPANPAQRGAYQRGYAARLGGLSIYANPYQAVRGWIATFSAAWTTGWRAADEVVPPVDHVAGDPTYPEEVPA